MDNSLTYLLLALLPISIHASPESSIYDEIPAYYTSKFEKGDKFSAILDYVRYVEKTALESLESDSCPSGRTRFPLSAFNKYPSNEPLYYDGFESYQRTALSIANLFNYIYQLANTPFKEWFKANVGGRSYSFEALWYSIVSSVVASDKKIFGCYVVLYNDSKMIGIVPHAFRIADKVVVEDYSTINYFKNTTVGFEWLSYYSHMNTNLTEMVSARKSRQIAPIKLVNAFSSGILKNSGNSSIKVVTTRDGVWDPPMFQCDKIRKWLISYRLPFFKSDNNDKLFLKGWVVLEFNLMHLEINRCKNESSFRTLYATDICNYATTKCVHAPGKMLSEKSFRCVCKKFFHKGDFPGDLVLEEYLNKAMNMPSNYSELECGPCPVGCEYCTMDGKCLIRYDLQFLRAVPMVTQIFCITICTAVGVVIFRSRRSRVIKSTVWILLEIFLIGVVILYSTIVLMYLEPTYEICFLLPWFREIGFTITYGTLIVKVYRILCSFQSRKAHRVHVKDRDLLKYLAGIVAVAIGYMAAWTATNLDHSQRARALLDSANCSSAMTDLLVLQDGEVSRGSSFRVCALGFWDMVTAMVECSVLILGLFYCYCVRSAPSDYSEVRCITIAFICELIFSLTYHILQHFIWLSLHPDYVYIISFARIHLTVTVTAVLVIGPKLWYIHNPPEVNAKDKKLRYSQVDTNLGEAINLNITSNGDIDMPEVNLADMDPDDIRGELKRLYTQLEIFKTKAMRKDNPHISKRRGGRKQTHRRTPSWRMQSFSLQAFHHKHSHKHQTVSVQEEEISKVSEDSSNSADGVDGERSAKDSMSRAT